MQDTAGEARTSSLVIYSYGPPHIAKQKQDDQLEHTFSSYVRTRDVTLKTCQRRWIIGRSGERGSGISVLAAQHDDDDDDDDEGKEGVEDWTKKGKEGFLAAPATVIKKDPKTSISRHADKLKSHEKIVRTAIKQGSSPDVKPIDYVIWVLSSFITVVYYYTRIFLILLPCPVDIHLLRLMGTYDEQNSQTSRH